LSQSTQIKYYLPDDMQHAHIIVQDISGRFVRQFDLTHSGEGEVIFNVLENGLKGGTYIYTLYVDGNKTDSKKMVLLTK